MKNVRKKFKRPRSPWNSDRIEAEKKILKEYGLRRKRELWKSEDILRNFRRRARELISESSDSEEKILLDKLEKLGLLKKGMGVDDILALEVRNVLDRRLQTLVFKKGLAKTIKDSRQKIVHGNIIVNSRRMKFPSYLVPVEKEKAIEVKGGMSEKGT